MPVALALHKGVEAARLRGWDVDDHHAVHILAATLRGRLEAACAAAIEPGRKVCDEALTGDSPEVCEFADFVAPAE